jgi:hypothetical protein
MSLHLPVRRFFQGIDKIEAPRGRFGGVQWVLTRALYRFRIFDLAQVPVKKRTQALNLELAQWTPFANSEYFIGWHQQQALVWAWDAVKVRQAIAGQGIKPKRLTVLPESVLHEPLLDGLSLTRCLDGFEGQLWREGQLHHSRWWPQLPTQDEWLMLQRDAGLAPEEQQDQPPAPRDNPLRRAPWVAETSMTGDSVLQRERLLIAICALLLWAPTCWNGLALYQAWQATQQLQTQRTQLQIKVDPILRSRGEALDYLARIRALRSLAPYPGQLALLAKIAEVLPNDRSYIKEWDFQQGQLKVTITAATDISTTLLVTALQKASYFSEVKALPGRDPKSILFQMNVLKTNG